MLVRTRLISSLALRSLLEKEPGSGEMFIVAVNISCLRHFFRQIRSPTLKGQAKISSAWAALASQRFGKGFAAKVTRFLITRVFLLLPLRRRI